VQSSNAFRDEVRANSIRGKIKTYKTVILPYLFFMALLASHTKGRT
jgi:fucose 4-O-acetylase-like acetyltransferase